jgi:hypothetical protein
MIAGVHDTDDADGKGAAEKIRTLLKFVKHPAYRLELLTSKVTGRFFCPVNGSVRLGQTPLHFAVSLGKWDAVVALLEDACCLLDECYTETGAKPGENRQLQSLKITNVDAARLKLAYKEQLKRQYSVLWTKDSQGNSVFHLAVIHNHQEMYKQLRDFSQKLSELLGKVYFGQKSNSGLVGSKFNNFESYDDEFLKNDNGYTPLELAAYLGNVDMMRFLLSFETQTKWSYGDKSVVMKQVRYLNVLYLAFALYIILIIFSRSSQFGILTLTKLWLPSAPSFKNGLISMLRRIWSRICSPLLSRAKSWIFFKASNFQNSAQSCNKNGRFLAND